MSGKTSQDFRTSIESIVAPLLNTIPIAEKDIERDYLKVPAPNIIEFISSPQLLNVPSVYKYVRQYQVIRDLFQLRCPICNSQKPEDIDCWGKTKTYLQSEELLTWSDKCEDDVCPKCGTTRHELIKDKLIERYNQFNLLCGMRCYCTNVQLYTNYGLIRLKDLLPPNPKVDQFYPLNNLQVFGENGWETVSDVYYAGNLPSKKITLAGGIEHVVSPVHPLYGFHNGEWGWHKTNELKIGEYVECRVAPKWYGVDTFNNVTTSAINNIKYAGKVVYTTPTEWSEDLAALIGYLISEGDVSTDLCFTFFNSEEETLQHFVALNHRLFNVKSARILHNAVFDIDVNHAGVRRFLKALGVKESVAKTKCVPEALWSASEPIICAFLRAYFEGDGTAAIEKESNKPTVSSYTVSKQLALETQQILWNLGIDATISASKSRKFSSKEKFDHDCYAVRVYGDNIIKYANKIGFYSARKQKALGECIEIVKNTKIQDSFIPGLRPVLSRIHNSISIPVSYHINNVISGQYDTASRFLVVNLIKYLKEYRNNHIEFSLLDQLHARVVKKSDLLNYFAGFDVTNEYNELYQLYLKTTGERTKIFDAIPLIKAIFNKIICKTESGMADTIAHIQAGEYKSIYRPRLKQILDYITEYQNTSIESTYYKLLSDNVDINERLIEYFTNKTFRQEDLQLLERLSREESRFLPIVKIEDGPEVPMGDLHVPGTHSFVANSVLNHNSGKTVTAALVGAYVEHRLMTLALSQEDGKLSTYFGLKPPFEVTFIASTEVQSNDTIWAHYRNARINSPWFNRCVEWLKKKQKEQHITTGMEGWKYQETTKEIENGFLNTKFNSKNSNSSGLAGRTRIASFIDELSRFKQSESSMGAEEAYRVMENSLRTIRSATINRDLLTWLGLIVSVSSPISVDDKSMELMYQSTKIKGMYAMHYATWDFNPDEKREYYNEAYEKDPVGTERDFGAKPPLAANPLIVDPGKFEERAVDIALQPTAKIEIIPFTDKTGQRYHKAQMVECQLSRDASRFICYDAGQNFDSFTGACGHLEIKQEGDNQEFISVIDWVLRILPSNGMEVWFDSCIDLIAFQMKHQKIAQIEFDRWNSVTLIQQIRNLGIRAEQKSIRPDDYIKFVADGQMGRIRLLPKEPGDDRLDPPFKSAAAVGLYELGRLERSVDDKRVINPQKGKRRGYNSDDVAVVLVHLHQMLQNSQIRPSGEKIRSRQSRLKSEEVMSQSWSFSNGGSIFNPARSGLMGAGGRRW